MMGSLYDADVRTISYHLKTIFADHELEEGSVLQFFRITAADGKSYAMGHYNLSAIIAIGYKVNSERAVQFRKWATGIIESFTIKDFAMDDERLKNDGSILGKKLKERSKRKLPRSHIFGEMLKQSLNAQDNLAISTREIIQKLIRLAGLSLLGTLKVTNPSKRGVLRSKVCTTLGLSTGRLVGS